MGSIFKETSSKLDSALARKNFQKFDADRKLLIDSVGRDIANMVTPAIKQGIAEGMAAAIKNQIINVQPPQVTVPTPKVDVNVPDVNVPTPQVTVQPPVVNVPEIKIPKLQWPEGDMPINGWVQLMGVSLENPLPVQLRDEKGKPVNFFEGMTQVINAGGGGGPRVVKISNDSGSPVPITGSLSATLAADTGSGEIGSDTLRMVMATDAVSSVNVYDAFGSTAVDSVFNADNRLRVSVETGGSGLTDAELRASSVPVAQASGAVWSVYVTDSTATGVTILNGEGAYRDTFPIEGTLTGITNDVNIADGGNSITVDGTVTVDTVTNTVGANIVDSSGEAYTTTNPLPIDDAGGSITVDGTVTVDSVTNSVAAALVDSGGVQYSSSNPVPIDDAGGSITVDGTVAVSNAITSVIAVGDVSSDAVDTSSAPVKIGGIARQANPTAVAAGDRVSATFDDVGRQVMRPLQVRDLLTTAYATPTTGVETTLLTGAASTYHDLVWIMGANQSNAAVTIDIRETTGGTVLATLVIPAESTAGIAPPIPFRQANLAGTWTVQNIGTDVSNTSVDITAEFSKEV